MQFFIKHVLFYVKHVFIQKIHAFYIKPYFLYIRMYSLWTHAFCITQHVNIFVCWQHVIGYETVNERSPVKRFPIATGCVRVRDPHARVSNTDTTCRGRKPFDRNMFVGIFLTNDMLSANEMPTCWWHDTNVQSALAHHGGSYITHGGCYIKHGGSRLTGYVFFTKIHCMTWYDL